NKGFKMKYLILSILAAAISSCTNGSSGSGNQTGNTTIPSSPQSEFSKIQTNYLYKGNACIEPGFGSVRYYFTKTDTNKALSEYDVFENLSCEIFVGNRVSYTVRRTLTAFNEIPNSTDPTFKEVSLALIKVEFMSLTPEQTTLLNNASYCGFSNWTVSQYRDITGCENAPTLSQGYVEYLNFRFISEDNKILLPDSNYYQ
ncbi:MAG: hypothetical protein ABL930_13420, partial [Pseudobdellovibrio sp.]